MLEYAAAPSRPGRLRCNTGAGGRRMRRLEGDNHS
jgi:hypothetical protein